jgi:hypothetical protein
MNHPRMLVPGEERSGRVGIVETVMRGCRMRRARSRVRQRMASVLV